MKMRCGFVSNSSTSSYLVIGWAVSLRPEDALSKIKESYPNIDFHEDAKPNKPWEHPILDRYSGSELAYMMYTKIGRNAYPCQQEWFPGDDYEYIVGASIEDGASLTDLNEAIEKAKNIGDELNLSGEPRILDWDYSTE